MKKYSCLHITPSTCVPYEGDLPEWSKHKDSDECVMISDVIEVRDLGESCVKVSGDKTVAKVLYALEDKICRE